MAVRITPNLVLPQKFERLKFDEEYVSSDNMSTPSTPSTPCTPPAEPYEVTFITEKDFEATIEFLRTFFFRDEPLNVNIKLLEGENARCLDLENYCLEVLKEGLSLKAVSASGVLIGVCLNGIVKREGDEHNEEICKHDKFKKILDLLDTVDEQANVFGLFPDADKYMSVKILSVDGKWRGRKIAQELMAHTRNLSKMNGCDLMVVVCTSNFSARAIKRLGFDCVYSLNYKDYKVNGETVFSPEHPHAAVTVYVQKIT